LPSYEIIVQRSAERELRKLPRDVQRRFAVAVDLLREDPRRPRPGCDVRLLSGLTTTWRLRVGDYRGFYVIAGMAVIFTKFGHRSNVYRF